MDLMGDSGWREDDKNNIPLVKGKGPVVIANRMQTDKNSQKSCGWEHIERYYSFLFNDSVFSDCYVTKDVERCFDKGITVRTDLPANLVVAACIATRQVWEYPEIGRSVSNLIKWGVEPRKAHLVGHHLIVRDNGTYTPHRRGGHVAIYGDRMGPKNIENFLEGRLPKGEDYPYNSLTYQTSRTYQGIPCMWGYKVGSNLRFREDVRRDERRSDPFGFVKTLGNLEGCDVVEEVSRAFNRLGEDQ